MIDVCIDFLLITAWQDFLTMAGVEIEPLPANPTADGALHNRDEDTDAVKEFWQGDGSLISLCGSPTRGMSEEMSMNADSLDLSDPCGDLDDEEMGSDGDEDFDPVFEEIKRSLSKLEKANQDKSSTASLSSAGASEEDGSLMRVSENYTNIPFGLQPRDVYEHGKKSTDIMGGTVVSCGC